MRLNIATKYGESITPQLSAQKLVNMYAEPADGKSNVVVHGSQGLTLFGTAGSGPIRGIKAHNGVLCVVSATTLYTVDSGGTPTSRGTISGSGAVGMASNGTNLCIVTGVGNSGYLWNGTALSTITDPDFGGANTVSVLDGYFIFTDGTESFFINETPFNGSNYDALDFASAESHPDEILSGFVDHREVLLFGERTTEAWYNSGDADFPFERTPGAVFEKGIAAAFAVAKTDNSVFWLDHYGVARRMAAGYVPERVSTHDIEDAISDCTLSTAQCIGFVDRGHEFFVLTFDEGTFIYDASTGLWHERVSDSETRWRVQHHEYLYGSNIVGDFEDGKLYTIDDGVYTENAVTLTSTMTFPPINMDGETFRLSKVQLDLEQGSAGTVTLSISEDGVTFTSMGSRSMGSATTDRTIWRNLGQHRNLHLRFSFASNVRRAVFSAYATIQ